MDNFLLSALIDEMKPQLLGKRLHKVLLVGSDLFFDFRLTSGLWLRAILDPVDSAPFIDQLPKTEANEAHPFIAHLKKELVATTLIDIDKPPLDRIAILTFETVAVCGEKKIAKLLLSFAGRNSNAYLADAENFIEAILKPRGRFRVEERFDYLHQAFEAQRILIAIDSSESKESMIEKVFNQPDSPFSPLLKQEFLVRCTTTNPKAALSSLFKDLLATPIPLLYSNFQPQEIQSNQIQLRLALNLKTHLLLSHFPLALAKERALMTFKFASLSAAAATYYAVLEKARLLQIDFTSLKKLLSEAIKKLQGLQQALSSDRIKFADPEKYKRFGDLLLANLSIAKVVNHRTRVIDYYDENQNEIEIEIGEGKSIQQAAGDYFALYQKARRAQSVIDTRLDEVTSQLNQLNNLSAQLNEDLTVTQLSQFKKQADHILGIKKKTGVQFSAAKKRDPAKPIGRWFRSTAGYDIVVGRNDKDNDAITFRLARSQDIWLHAADYPGSHVVIRNPNRQEIPLKVIQEAAELAAFHSQAKGQNKVAVHYTEKKFVTKPPRAKPGLVRLSSFKTLLVEPKSVLEKMEGQSR